MTTRNLKIAGVCAALAVAGFIGWGLWLAAHPAQPPLQGQAEARTVDVAARIAGRIHSINVKEGDTVKAGAVLATIEIPELTARLGQVTAQSKAAQAKADLVNEGARREQIEAARAQYQSVKAKCELAKKTFARVDALYAEGLVSAQKHDEARAARDNAINGLKAAQSQMEMAETGSREGEKTAAMAQATQAAMGVKEVSSLASESDLVAPRAGEVVRVVMEAGEVSPAGFPIVTLIDRSDSWVVFNIREDQMPGIRVGTKFMADIPAINGKNIPMTVYWMNARADYATWRATRQSSGFDVRTFEVRARPDSPLADLRPGMSVLVPR